jgi:hypothetical protein
MYYGGYCTIWRHRSTTVPDMYIKPSGLSPENSLTRKQSHQKIPVHRGLTTKHMATASWASAKRTCGKSQACVVRYSITEADIVSDMQEIVTNSLCIKPILSRHSLPQTMIQPPLALTSQCRQHCAVPCKSSLSPALQTARDRSRRPRSRRGRIPTSCACRGPGSCKNNIWPPSKPRHHEDGDQQKPVGADRPQR